MTAFEWPSKLKPMQWPVEPQLTAAPELWGGHYWTIPIWNTYAPLNTDPGSDDQHPGSDVISDAIVDSSFHTGDTPTYELSERGPALSFDGSNRIRFGRYLPSSLPALNEAITIDVVFRLDSTSSDGVLVHLADSSGSNATAGLCALLFDKSAANSGNSNTFALWFDDLNSRIEGPSGVGTIGWHHIRIGQIDRGSGAEFFMIVDGIDVTAQSSVSGSTSASTDASNWDYVCIGNEAGGGRGMVGAVAYVSIRARKQRQLSLDPYAMIRPGPQLFALLFGDAGGGGTTITADRTMQIAWLAGIVADRAAPVEYQSKVTLDRVTRIEYLERTQADGQSLFESLATATADRTTALEHTLTLAADRQSHIDHVASLQADAQTPVEHQATTQADRLTPLEWQGSTAVTADRVALIEWVQSLQADRQTPLEWQGAVTVTADRLTPIEWAGSIQADAKTPIEHLGSIIADRTARADHVITVTVDKTAFLESLETLGVDRQTLMEWDGSAAVMADIGAVTITKEGGFTFSNPTPVYIILAE